jgi:hypothetical protein
MPTQRVANQNTVVLYNKALSVVAMLYACMCYTDTDCMFLCMLHSLLQVLLSNWGHAGLVFIAYIILAALWVSCT